MFFLFVLFEWGHSFRRDDAYFAQRWRQNPDLWDQPSSTTQESTLKSEAKNDVTLSYFEELANMKHLQRLEKQEPLTVNTTLDIKAPLGPTSSGGPDRNKRCE